MHDALGVTPLQAWMLDTAEIVPADVAALRAAMRHSDTRKVNGATIHFDNREYTCAELSSVEKHKVSFLYRNTDRTSIEVDLGGGVFVTAYDKQHLPEDEKARIIARRAPAAMRFNARISAADIIRSERSLAAQKSAAALFTPEEMEQARAEAAVDPDSPVVLPATGPAPQVVEPAVSAMRLPVPTILQEGSRHAG